MKRIFFITIFFSSLSLAQIQQLESTFTFKNEFNNSQSLIFGYDPYGTDGLDPQLGEVVVPQVPPGEFGVRFQLPTDTSIYTVKDIRFGCGQPFYYEHLVDFSYATGSNTIHISWTWDWGLYMFDFKDPFTGLTLAHYELFYDSTHFIIPTSLEKIIIGVYYDGPLSWPMFNIVSPNGGNTLLGGEYHNITWLTNWWVPTGKLEYSLNGGTDWILITDSLPYPNMNYQWLVPYVNSTSCLVRVGDYPCYYDQSNNFFTITYPVNVEEEQDLPTEFSLSQNYPNPFNPTTKIKYTIPSLETRHASSLQNVTLKVYDVLGNEVATLVNEEKPAGNYEVEFNATGLPSGIYFYQLKAGSFIETKKMILLK